jgi:hypothetical protein
MTHQIKRASVCNAHKHEHMPYAWLSQTGTAVLPCIPAHAKGFLFVGGSMHSTPGGYKCRSCKMCGTGRKLLFTRYRMCMHYARTNSG